MVPTMCILCLGTKHQGPRASATILAPAAAGVLCGAPGVVVGLAVGTTAYGAPTWGGGMPRLPSVEDDVDIYNGVMWFNAVWHGFIGEIRM